MDLYVYYKVAAADAAPLQSAVQAMQGALATNYGVHGQLKRRPPSQDGAQDGGQTWMEVYPAVPDGFADGFAAVLAQAVTAAGLARWISGPRHTEVFMDMAPCA